MDREAHPLDSLVFGSLHFGGELSRRDMSGKQEVKGRLFFAHAGDVIYSKIDARNGAIGIIPEEMPLVVFSSEYPIYAVDTAKASPDFIKLLFRTASFRSRINSLVSGASGRKRVEPTTLESIRVPLLPLSSQQMIVDHWKRTKAASDRVWASEAELSNRLNNWLRKRTNPAAFQFGRIVVSWSGIDSWNAQNARASIFRTTNPDFVPLLTYAEDATELVRPKQKPKHEWPVYGVNNREGVFFSHTQLGVEFNSPYKKIQKDWFFHNPTRSNVGSLGHVGNVPEDAITSPEYQVWKLRDLGQDSLEPGFVAVLIQTEWFVKVIQFHRVGAVKQRLYVENLLSIPVPEFPKSIQQEITAARERIVAERAAASKLATDTAREVEEMILGHRPVSA